MKYYLCLLLLFLFPRYIYSQVLFLKTNKKGVVLPFSWNVQTPLALDQTLGIQYEFSILVDDLTVPMIKTLETNFGQIQYVYRFNNPLVLSNSNSFNLLVMNDQNLWPFNNHKVKVSINTNIPELEIISISSSITHGGSGLVVVKSIPKSNLNLLAVVDEKDNLFYPRTFVKDGYYVILFPWYSDYSNDWNKSYILAVDNSGNIKKIPLDTKPITRKYINKVINLPSNYASQKAAELSLSKEEAKKIEGNITAINSLLAQQKRADRWKLTRSSFEESVKEVIKTPRLFSEPVIPMKNYIPTANYGDKRSYIYKKQQVRQSIHRGLDMASIKNAPIYALMSGTVVYSDWNGGNGKTIFIDHGMGVYSFYAHNEELLVKEGQRVKAGQQISVSGTTGQSTGDHLHLSLIVQGIYVEPKEWLNGKSINKQFNQPLQRAYDFIYSKQSSKQ